MSVEPTEIAPPRGFRPSRIARSLGVSRSIVYALIESGELPAVRFGEKGLLVLEHDLLQYLEARRLGKPDPRASGAVSSDGSAVKLAAAHDDPHPIPVPPRRGRGRAVNPTPGT